MKRSGAAYIISLFDSHILLLTAWQPTPSVSTVILTLQKPFCLQDQKLHMHFPYLVITPCCSRLDSVFPSRSSKIYPPKNFLFFQIITWQAFHNKKLCTYFLHMKIQILLDPNSHHRAILEQMAFIQMISKLPTFRDHCHKHKCLKIKFYRT